MNTCIHSIQCIIPPHMQKNIAENGTAEQRERAMNAIATSASLRAQRVALTEMTLLFFFLVTSRNL